MNYEIVSKLQAVVFLALFALSIVDHQTGKDHTEIAGVIIITQLILSIFVFVGGAFL